MPIVIPVRAAQNCYDYRIKEILGDDGETRWGTKEKYNTCTGTVEGEVPFTDHYAFFDSLAMVILLFGLFIAVAIILLPSNNYRY